MVSPDSELHALRAAVFEGELTADDARGLIDALLTRKSQLEAARERGEAAPEHLLELATVDDYLGVLRSEATIAQFVDEALEATFRRYQALAQASESDAVG